MMRWLRYGFLGSLGGPIGFVFFLTVLKSFEVYKSDVPVSLSLYLNPVYYSPAAIGGLVVGLKTENDFRSFLGGVLGGGAFFIFGIIFFEILGFPVT